MDKPSTAKHKAMLPNGRSAKGAPKFENWHCRFFPKDLSYPAWRSLSACAKDVALIMRAKNDHAGATGKKDAAGRPVFSFTATEAERVFHVPRPTFCKAVKALVEIGFVEIARHGGVLSGNGIPALYRLSDRWKEWKPPARDNTNITKARAARKKSGGYG